MKCCRCPYPASAWMTFEYSASRIEMFELPDESDGYGGYALCDRHAGRMTAPVGWNLVDSRATMLTLFPVADIASPAMPAVDVA